MAVVEIDGNQCCRDEELCISALCSIYQLLNSDGVLLFATVEQPEYGVGVERLSFIGPVRAAVRLPSPLQVLQRRGISRTHQGQKSLEGIGLENQAGAFFPGTRREYRP